MNKKLICTILTTSILLSGCGNLNSDKTSNPVDINPTVTQSVVANTPNKEESKVDDNKPEDTNKNKIDENINISGLSTKTIDWGFKPMGEGVVSQTTSELVNLLGKYSSYYVGDTSKKEIYLTFDEGYENGYTGAILDVLKQNNVKAAFFVTLPYVKANNALIKRMVDEGHLVCNHSNTHPVMPKIAISGKSKFDKEFTDVEQAFETLTGKKMPHYFRPPQGKFSELSLYYTKALGYKSIFWSCAYDDWNVNKQRTHDYAKNIIKARTHNGAIVLLHAVSKTNTEILDSVIKDWMANGYELKSLESLPNK